MNTPCGAHKQTEHEYQFGEALSSDSAGPMPHVGLVLERHFFTFIEVATRFPAAIPVVGRGEILELIDATFNNFRDNYGCTPQTFVSYNAAEYLSAKVQQHTLHVKNCEHVPTPTYSPEENVIAERLSRTLWMPFVLRCTTQKWTASTGRSHYKMQFSKQSPHA